MSRDIKFRGLTPSNEWVYGNVSIITDSRCMVGCGTYISNRAGMPFAYDVIPETVGQFTGLHDKNGTEIYEGDKLKRGDYIFTVLQESSGAWIARRNVVSGTVQFMVETIAFQCEVVGNIYQTTDTVEQS